MTDTLRSALLAEADAATPARGRGTDRSPGRTAAASGADGFELLHEVLTELIEDPDSTEPFSRLLDRIILDTQARGGALYVGTESGRQMTLLACSRAEERGFWERLPWLPGVEPAAPGSVFLEDDMLAPGGSLACLPLEQGDQGRGLLVLRFHCAPPELGPPVVGRLSAHAGRLSRILYSTRRARLKLRDAQCEERAAIARELHDSLAQSLSYMKIQVSLLQRLVGERGSSPPDDAELEALASELRDTVGVAYRHLRELITTFRLTMHGRSFARALEDSLHEFESRSSIAFELDNRLPAGRLRVAEEMQLLQIVREALANVVRHSHANWCRVSLRLLDGHGIRLEVEDNGIGLEAPRQSSQHHGVLIMQERAHALGGTLRLGLREGGGSRVEVLCRGGHAPGNLDAGEPDGT